MLARRMVAARTRACSGAGEEKCAALVQVEPGHLPEGWESARREGSDVATWKQDKGHPATPVPAVCTRPSRLGRLFWYAPVYERERATAGSYGIPGQAPRSGVYTKEAPDKMLPQGQVSKEMVAKSCTVREEIQR